MAPTKNQSTNLPISVGLWTPAPLQLAQSGTPQAPAFQSFYGLLCEDKIHLVRFGNTINGNQIDVSVIASKEVPWRSGVWTPTPLQSAVVNDPATPQFHVMWAIAYPGRVVMVRFSNSLAGSPHIGVDTWNFDLSRTL